MRLTTRLRGGAALFAAAALALAGCSGGNSAPTDQESASGGSVVIDTAFSIETTDPGHAYDTTAATVIKALYSTLTTFSGTDLTQAVPDLATWEANADGTEFTFTLTDGQKFSDGSPIEAKDVVFSLTRIQAMEDAKPNFLLSDITITQRDDKTVVFTTKTPMLQLPAILATPSLGILNSDVVSEQGGSTDGDDTAQEFLDGESAGSGPYVLDTLDLTSQVVLTKNPEYTGDDPGGFDRVVLRNVTESATQLVNLQGGDTDVAMDLNGDQVEQLGDDFTVNSTPSAQTIFLLLNQDPSIGGPATGPEFAEAVRLGLDYPALLELAGAGAIQATGVIPPSFEGALPSGVTYDLDQAKAALAASDYNGETITLSYPNDYPVGGVEFTPLAERIQSQLNQVGITVELAPAPFATELDAYVGGKEGFGLWFWGPDYADSTSFLPFAPGNTVGLRAGWTADDAPDIAELAADAAAAPDPDSRTPLFTQYAQAMQESGPFVPLIVPGSNISTSTSVTGVAYNPVWTMDIAALRPAA